MGLISGEEGGWMREEITNFVLASLASLQLWQGAPSSTTRMPRHLAVMSCLATCLSELLAIVLTHFPSPLLFPFSCTSLVKMLSHTHIRALAMSICLLHHKALCICQTCLESRCKPAKRIQTRDTLISSLMVCLSEWRQFRRLEVR
jgi:hypothetical protein